jgi:hypothetical protein
VLHELWCSTSFGAPRALVLHELLTKLKVWRQNLIGIKIISYFKFLPAEIVSLLFFFFFFFFFLRKGVWLADGYLMKRLLEHLKISSETC